MMEEKLLHAEFKREVQLQAIVKKAQEEEAKVNYFVLKGNYLIVLLVYVLYFRVLVSRLWRMVQVRCEHVWTVKQINADL